MKRRTFLKLAGTTALGLVNTACSAQPVAPTAIPTILASPTPTTTATPILPTPTPTPTVVPTESREQLILNEIPHSKVQNVGDMDVGMGKKVYTVAYNDKEEIVAIIDRESGLVKLAVIDNVVNRFNVDTKTYLPITDFTGLHEIKADSIAGLDQGFTTALFQEKPVEYITDEGRHGRLDPNFARTAFDDGRVWLWENGRWKFEGTQPPEPTDPTEKVDVKDVPQDIQKVVEISIKSLPGADQYTIKGWSKNTKNGRYIVWFNNQNMKNEVDCGEIYNYPGVGSVLVVMPSSVGEAYRKYAMLPNGDDQVIPMWQVIGDDKRVPDAINMLRVIQQTKIKSFKDAGEMDSYMANNKPLHPEEELHLVMMFMPAEDQERFGFPWNPYAFDVPGFMPGRDIKQVTVDNSQHTVILSGMSLQILEKGYEYDYAISAGRGVEGAKVNSQTGVPSEEEQRLRLNLFQHEWWASLWFNCAEIIAEKKRLLIHPMTDIMIGAEINNAKLKNFAMQTGVVIQNYNRDNFQMITGDGYFLWNTAIRARQMNDYIKQDQQLPSDAVESLKSVFADYQKLSNCYLEFVCYHF